MCYCMYVHDADHTASTTRQLELQILHMRNIPALRGPYREMEIGDLSDALNSSIPAQVCVGSEVRLF